MKQTEQGSMNKDNLNAYTLIKVVSMNSLR